MTVVINGTTGIDTGTGAFIAADATTAGYVRLFEDTDNGSNYIDLIAPASVASNRTITLPDVTGTLLTNATAGTVLQVVQGTTSTEVSSSSSTFADTGLSASITPSSASSKILILVSHGTINKSSASSSNRMTIRLVRGSTTLGALHHRAVSVVDGNVAGQHQSIVKAFENILERYALFFTE